MFNLCLFGGGRWARVILTVLTEVIPSGSKISWVTKHCYPEATDWLSKQKFPVDINIELTQKDNCFEISGFDAAIVATNSASHAENVEYCINNHIPVLCEKPLSLGKESSMSLVEAATQESCLLGVNYLFVFASYLHDFKSKIEKVELEVVNMEWHDPFHEERYGELKHGDFSSSVVYDQFSHCCSIISVLFPKNVFTSIDSVEYKKDSEIVIQCTSSNVKFLVSLSRRSNVRKRTIQVNDNLILDYSIEPGFVREDEIESQNVWQDKRPLEISLRNFLGVVNKRISKVDWDVHIDKNKHLIDLCAQGEGLLMQEFDRVASLLKNNGLYNIDSSMFVNLMIDKYAPIFTKLGERVELQDEKKRRLFAEKCLFRECR